MKKVFAIFLAVALCLSFCACGSKDKTVNQEQGFKYAKQIFEANRNFMTVYNHSSVSYTIRNNLLQPVPDPDATTSTTTKPAETVSYCYQTSDFEYEETVSYIDTPVAIRYKKANREYYLYNYKDGALSGKFFCGDLRSSFSHLSYQIVPQYDIDWYDSNSETFTDIYEKDGLLYLVSKKNKITSEHYIVDLLGGTYNDETVSTELVVDAKTYEIRKITHSNAKTGKPIYSVEVKYDEAEPIKITNMRDEFEDQTKERANVKLVLNPTTSTSPGTTAEIAVTFTTIAGYSVSYKVDSNVNVTRYSNPECTVAYTSGSWDRKSDLEIYFVSKAK